ncbi:MAG: pantetheine-phosphate adenylyltransferase [Bryobacterales bacterium]|nr:pantetheine-phosphate adenylyltransferase [Bryobacterales bacterium]
MAKSRVAIYPGSFDPITNGHLDLIGRAASQFEELVVAVLRHDTKDADFPLPERLEMIRKSVHGLANVRVASFDGLLVDFARQQNASLIVRGIRAVSDYEYELQMALMNRKLAPGVETVFMLPGEAYGYLSSRLVKEVCQHGGEIDDFVPPHVAEALRARPGKFNSRHASPDSGETGLRNDEGRLGETSLAAPDRSLRE